MKQSKFVVGVLIIAFVLSVSGAVGVLASSSDSDGPNSSVPDTPQAEPGWEQMNSSGFGDPDASEVTALAVFDNHLYAGTHNATDGARIFRSPDGATWVPVIDPGFGNPHDTAPPAILDLTVIDGYLYASTGWGEDPAKIWRTSNGLYWAPVVNNGFSNADNVDATVLAEYNGMLYAGVTNRVDGVEIWRSYTGDSNSWTQDNPATLVAAPAAVTGLFVFDGALFAAIESDGPAQIWRTYGGSSGWTPVISDGFGNDLSVFTGGMVVFGNMLYVGAGNAASGAELWRSTDGENWAPATIPAAADTNNESIESLFVFGSQLYVSVRNAITGIEVWRTADSALWEQSNVDGFGDSANSGSNRSNATTTFLDQLFLGTANSAGGELWRLAPPALLPAKVYLPTVQRLP